MAATIASTMPGSALECPERSTITSSLPGQACASRHAVSIGLLMPSRPLSGLRSPVRIGILKAMLRKAGLSEDEFLDLPGRRKR